MLLVAPIGMVHTLKSTLYTNRANSIFTIRISQSLASQSTTISGTTGGAGKHHHTTTLQCWRGADGNTPRVAWESGDTRVGSGTKAASTNEVAAHTHSFSAAATIGSGNYTRPYSVSCKFYIRY